jgi:thioredoxin 1
MNKFQDIIAGDTPVLVDFFAEWCGPCKIMKPVLEELKKKMGNKIIILKIDIDKNISLSSEYRIQSVPTLVLWKQGEIIWRQSGALSLNELEQILSSYIR